MMKSTKLIGMAMLLGAGFGMWFSNPTKPQAPLTRRVVEQSPYSIGRPSHIDSDRDYDDYFVLENGMPREMITSSR
jgi:hypothetical protein